MLPMQLTAASVLAPLRVRVRRRAAGVRLLLVALVDDDDNARRVEHGAQRTRPGHGAERRGEGGEGEDAVRGLDGTVGRRDEERLGKVAPTRQQVAAGAEVARLDVKDGALERAQLLLRFSGLLKGRGAGRGWVGWSLALSLHHRRRADAAGFAPHARSAVSQQRRR